MKGFYSIWTKPFLNQKNQEDFFLQDYELLTLIISVGAFQKYNGSAAIYADQLGVDYLLKNGLAELFLDGVHLMDVPKDIDASVFWAAGKIIALQQIEHPRVMIDLDLIIWKNLDKQLLKSDIAVIHKEDITEEIYPNWKQFEVTPEYHFHNDWNDTERPANTALLFIQNMEFKDYYTKEAIEFMQAYRGKKDNLCPMVFAEQRMLALCAKEREMQINDFFPQLWDLDRQDLFTHVWGHKSVLKFNMEQRIDYCMRCVRRIKKEFPEVYSFVKQQEMLEEYVKGMEER